MDKLIKELRERDEFLTKRAATVIVHLRDEVEELKEVLRQITGKQIK